MTNYYIDSCIYLNLWQKEKNKIGRPIWRFAKNFLEKIETNDSTIYYSGFLLKELSFILTKNEFNREKLIFEFAPNFKKIKLTPKEYELAKTIDAKNKIGLYDTIHLLLSKKSNSILVTRDRKLLKLAKKYKIMAKKPEQIL